MYERCIAGVLMTQLQLPIAYPDAWHVSTVSPSTAIFSLYLWSRPLRVLGGGGGKQCHTAKNSQFYNAICAISWQDTITRQHVGGPHVLQITTKAKANTVNCMLHQKGVLVRQARHHQKRLESNNAARTPRSGSAALHCQLVLVNRAPATGQRHWHHRTKQQARPRFCIASAHTYGGTRRTCTPNHESTRV